MPLNSPAGLKTAKSSPARAHWGGGGGGATRGTRNWVRGPIYKKKVVQDPGPNPHTVAAVRKEFLTHPQPRKRGTRVGGGDQKIHWGIIFCSKAMILQGVGRLILDLGVCYTNDP